MIPQPETTSVSFTKSPVRVQGKRTLFTRSKTIKIQQIKFLTIKKKNKMFTTTITIKLNASYRYKCNIILHSIRVVILVKYIFISCSSLTIIIRRKSSSSYNYCLSVYHTMSCRQNPLRRNQRSSTEITIINDQRNLPRKLSIFSRYASYNSRTKRFSCKWKKCFS